MADPFKGSDSTIISFAKFGSLIDSIIHWTGWAVCGKTTSGRRCCKIAEIQSFEVANLKQLRKKLGRPANVRLMQLVLAGGHANPVRPADVVAAGGSLTFRVMVTPHGLRQVASYADVIAPPIRGVIPLGKDERLEEPTPLVAHAHRAGLLVHV